MATEPLNVSLPNGIDNEKLNKTSITDVQDTLNFDPVALKAKYLEEREKRIRAHPDGVEQYRAIEGSLAHYLKDPWVNDEPLREPLTVDCEVLIIGAGYGGQLMAQKLLAQGITDFKIVEKGGDFGGAW